MHQGSNMIRTWDASDKATRQQLAADVMLTAHKYNSKGSDPISEPFWYCRRHDISLSSHDHMDALQERPINLDLIQIMFLLCHEMCQSSWNKHLLRCCTFESFMLCTWKACRCSMLEYLEVKTVVFQWHGLNLAVKEEWNVTTWFWGHSPHFNSSPIAWQAPLWCHFYRDTENLQGCVVR